MEPGNKALKVKKLYGDPGLREQVQERVLEILMEDLVRRLTLTDKEDGSVSEGTEAEER